MHSKIEDFNIQDLNYLFINSEYSRSNSQSPLVCLFLH